MNFMYIEQGSITFDGKELRTLGFMAFKPKRRPRKLKKKHKKHHLKMWKKWSATVSGNII